MANLNEAVQLIRQGHKDEARRILEPLLKAEPTNLQVWFWYVETCATLEQRIKTLEICLRVNPGNPQALQALQTLRAKQGVPLPPASASISAPAPKNDDAPDWARRHVPEPVVTPAAPIAPPPSAFQSTSAFEFDEQEPEPAQPADGGHWQQSWGESKPAFDWEALEKDTHQQAPAPLAGSEASPVAEKSRPKAKKSRPDGPSLPFHQVWLTALTTQSVDGYAAILDDPEAEAGRAFEWMAYASVLTGLLSPLALLNTPQLAELRATPEFQQLTGSLNWVTVLMIMGLAMAVLTPILGVIQLAISAGIQNFLAVFMGGKGTFGRTTYALAAYQVPVSLLTTLLGIIPVVGPCLAGPLGLYSLVLNVRALQASHDLPVVRALMVIFLPSILIFVLCCLGIIIFWPALMNAAGG